VLAVWTLEITKLDKTMKSIIEHQSRKSFKKWNHDGQNNGIGTVKQMRQRITDHRKHKLAMAQSRPAMIASTQFSLGRWTHASRINFRKNKYAPVVGSQMRVIHEGGTRIGSFRIQPILK
jgi:hypothetical protein